MSQVGPLPVQCDIEAADLEEALRKFPQALARAVEEMMEEANEKRRQESSRICGAGRRWIAGRAAVGRYDWSDVGYDRREPSGTSSQRLDVDADGSESRRAVSAARAHRNAP